MALTDSNILGCLLGTAVGDACGLRREGISPRRARRLFGDQPIAPDLMCGRGLCSDDTEHTLMVARAWAQSAGELVIFERQLARQFRCWLLTAPAGIGWATLRACCKLLIGFGPDRSGVWSAGNGPAMRSAILGLLTSDEEELNQVVRLSTRITHTDPRAETGALLIARAARLQVYDPSKTPCRFIEQEAERIVDSELKSTLQAVLDGLRQQLPCTEFANSQGWSNGVSGYVNRTVPAAIYCWARWPDDFRMCVSEAVRLGGDADTVGAIAGAICGANLGANAIPEDWTARLAEWPRNVEWLKQLTHVLLRCRETGNPATPPPMHWPATLLRNAMFASIVVGICLRRLLPPY